MFFINKDQNNNYENLDSTKLYCEKLPRDYCFLIILTHRSNAKTNKKHRP